MSSEFINGFVNGIDVKFCNKKTWEFVKHLRAKYPPHPDPWIRALFSHKDLHILFPKSEISGVGVQDAEKLNVSASGVTPMDVDTSAVKLADAPEGVKPGVYVEATEAVPKTSVKAAAEGVDTQEDSIVYTQITLDSPEPMSDEAAEGPAYDVALVEKLGCGDVDLSKIPTKQLEDVFGFLHDDQVCNILTSVCNMPAMDQSRYITLVAKQFPLLPFTRDLSVGMSRHLSTAVGSFVEMFCEVSCTLLLPPLVVNAPSHHPHTNVVVRDLITEKVKLTEHKKLLLRRVVAGMSDLSEEHVPLLLSLIGRYEDEILRPLVLLMAATAGKFAGDSTFGKLLVAVIQNLPKGTTLKAALLVIAARHTTVLGKKAINLLKKN